MTQGLLTIVNNYEVKYKVVTGHDGYDMFQLAQDIIRESSNLDIEVLYDMAYNVFECKSSLVVVSETGILYKGDDEVPDNKDSLYRTTFNNAHFNPRWLHGTATYVLILDLTNKVLRW